MNICLHFSMMPAPMMPTPTFPQHSSLGALMQAEGKVGFVDEIGTPIVGDVLQEDMPEVE